MAHITTFMYCEEAGVENNKTIISNPLLNLTLKYIPGTFSFNISVGIIDVDTKISHVMQVIMRHCETGKEVINTEELNIPPSQDEDKLPRELRGALLNLGFKNVDFTEQGKYETQITWDREDLGCYPIQVVEVR